MSSSSSSKLLSGGWSQILSFLFLFFAVVALVFTMDIITWTTDWKAAIMHLSIPGY
jgi:hypothetical protein